MTSRRIWLVLAAMLSSTVAGAGDNTDIVRDLAIRVGPVVGSALACRDIARPRIQAVIEKFAVVIRDASANEAERSDQPGGEQDPEQQHCYSGCGEDDAPDECCVVDAGAHAPDGSDEVGIPVVEAALHLVEEPLLLFGKWHPVPSLPNGGGGMSALWAECSHGRHN